ncbi:hypothetical protein KF840_21150 [bacterium]|nr:hypothetical protein [bacterium]
MVIVRVPVDPRAPRIAPSLVIAVRPARPVSGRRVGISRLGDATRGMTLVLTGLGGTPA